MGTMRLKRIVGDDALFLKTIDSNVQLYCRESQWGPRKELAWSEAMELLSKGRADLLETFVVVGQVVARI